MKWNEALFTLNSDNLLDQQQLQELLNLSSQRDKVFASYIEDYWYEPEREYYYETKMPDSIVSTFQMGLISQMTNRRLSLGLSFLQNGDIYHGTINDSIFITDKDHGWGNMIEMDILIKKRKGAEHIPDYRRLSNYDGTLEEKLYSCLTQIKINYDTYALDIISGEFWDDKARDLSFI
jgi:hypothetical protein